MVSMPLRSLFTVALLALAVAAPPARAAGDDPRLPTARTYLQVSPQGQDDLESLFQALEESVLAGERQGDPVIVVLHGPEALPFIRSNYPAHRELVDRAAKLQAFRRIELRMCETWMRRNGYAADDLLPFVDTVPLAPAEVQRLERDGYVRYGGGQPPSQML